MRHRRPLTALLFGLALAALILSGTDCQWLLPFRSTTAPSTYTCTAQIYRQLPGGNEFTENWQAWIWPFNPAGSTDDTYVQSVCQVYLMNYMEQLAPDFSWSYRNLAHGTDLKPVAADFGPSYTTLFGGPVGSTMATYTPNATLQMTYTDANGNTQTVTAGGKNANFTYADRKGRDVVLSGGGTMYDRRNHHVRISDIRLEFNDFTLPAATSQGDLTVKNFFFQSIGETFGEDAGSNAFTILPGNVKFYTSATLAQGGESRSTNQNLVNPLPANVTVVNYGSPTLSFYFQNNQLQGFPQVQYMRISVSPLGDPYLAGQHQPFVYLKDKTWPYGTTGIVLLPDSIGDTDGDIDINKILWFENFEDFATEKYLGNGLILGNLSLSHGTHEITVVVYDSRGSYYTSTMNLLVTIPGDVDNDGQVCSKDIQLIMKALGQKATGPNDLRDVDGDGWITILDARKAVTLCTHTNCLCV